jgi:hypothetical protein
MIRQTQDARAKGIEPGPSAAHHDEIDAAVAFQPLRAGAHRQTTALPTPVVFVALASPAVPAMFRVIRGPAD